ncbi:dTDP-4-dehydrorhamnose reductase [bacterium]|nr:dTDP-4-dehydrorhamnose reductase [bacterium]
MEDNGNNDGLSPGAADRPRRVLVTGGAGMLGSQVLLAVPDDIEALGTDMREAPGVDVPGVDLTDAAQVEALFVELAPIDGVIHTAAYTAVDRAEEESELAHSINGDACGVLARAAARAGIPMVLVSTDFVFDGQAETPYPEEAPTSPQSVYGATKLAGEAQALAAHPAGAKVVRTQWLYGPRGSHFPHTMQRLAKERDRLKVVSDQIGSPTSTLELAPALWDVLISGEPGIWHAACSGECSWFDLAVATIEASEIEGVEVEPCSTEEFPRPAARPAYSALDCSKLEGLRGKPMAPWRDALLTYLGSESS